MLDLHLKQIVFTFPLFVPVHRTHKHELGCLLFGSLGQPLTGGRLLPLFWLAVLEAASWLMEADDILLGQGLAWFSACLSWMLLTGYYSGQHREGQPPPQPSPSGVGDSVLTSGVKSTPS